jgi:hypothetical protein
VLAPYALAMAKRFAGRSIAPARTETEPSIMHTIPESLSAFAGNANEESQCLIQPRNA